MAKMAKRAHFGPGLFRFLKELRLHNQRDWFLANQQRFEEEVRQPFLALIEDLAPGLKKINPYFVADPSPNRGSMMRIYRDTRFSKDKSPYKTFVAAHFWHAKGKEGAAPAYYLRLQPGESMIGGGMWMPETRAVKQVRDQIVADPKGWQKATSGLEFGSACSMAGESLKRPPAGFDANHPLIEDIKRKDFAFSSCLTDQEVTREGFMELVLKRYRAAGPFQRFLSSAVGLP